MTGQKILESFDDFNDASRMTLFQARFAVAELGGEVISPAHLVLGLLKGSPETVARFLVPSDSIEAVTQEVKDQVPTGVRVSQAVEVPISRDAELVLSKAVDGTGPAKVVRPEHILLALLENDHDPAVDVLRRHGVVERDVRNFLSAPG